VGWGLGWIRVIPKKIGRLGKALGTIILQEDHLALTNDYDMVIIRRVILKNFITTYYIF